jgi:hypothetical protein
MKTLRLYRLLHAALGVPMLLAGCSGEGGPAAPTPAQGAQALISDQLHNGGTQGFFFLPPMVPAPGQLGDFVTTATPTVRIDELDERGRTVRTLATFSTEARPRAQRILVRADRGPGPWGSAQVGHYYVDWNTQNLLLSDSARYRVRVFVPAAAERGTRGAPGETRGGTRELGFADVDVVRSLQEFRSVDTVNFTPLLDGSVLQIKFRIERPAVDGDGDGVFDWLDNCPAHANADQRDSDRDGQGDACECAGVICRASRQACTVAGVCDPTSGRCSRPTTAPDGTACVLDHAAAACLAGVCDRSACATGFGNCNRLDRDGCETALTTTRHCGACGVACAAVPNSVASCATGTCTFTCRAGWADANNDRADGCELRLNSNDNCGAPGNACVSSEGHLSTCARGACSTIACPTARANCNTAPQDGCEVDIATDVAHCGDCQNACVVPNATAACRAGACAVGTCNAGFADCDADVSNGCETTPGGDVSHCGACGNACALANATPVCTTGACAIASCNEGFADCNGNAADGCEVNLALVTSCGACGSVCDLPNATPACTAGACTVGACTAGFADCNSDAGCETSLSAVTSCGGCGVVCATGPHATATCGTGGCGIVCAAGFADCDGVASNGCEVDTTLDSDHCGACGTVCGNATTCQAGACTTAVCVTGHADCNGLGGDGCETTPASDPGHCGACGHACSFANAAPECVGGACDFSVCDMGYADCDGQQANGCEVALGNDAQHCGGCAVRCTYAHATGVCGNGTCALGTCDAGWADCNGNPADGCEVNLTTDLTHCGACGTACAAASNASSTCTAGSCGIVCVTNHADCDGDARNGCETNTGTDLTHCGACGTTCTQGRTCVSGACTATACTAPLANCDGAEGNGCEVSTATDTFHCGACGHACAFANAGASCAAGACVMGACAPGFGNCDGNPSNGCEVNLLTNGSHCGGCGTACNAINGASTCAQGSCQLAACNTGYGNCDQLAFNGCEVSTTSDVNHCGGCGIVCPARPSAVATCHASACGYACVAGRLDCDGVASNGCEIDASADNHHCGGCGVVCTQGRTCQSGACTTAVCVAGTGDCDHDANNGCEASFASSAAHCGGCGIACSYAHATGVCTAGSCSLGTCSAGWANCNASSADGCEVNTATSLSHCGACGLVCPSSNGTAACVAGVCGMSSCNAGYTLSGSVCVDINECATNNGGCAVGQSCTNTQGGFGCGCAAGLTSCGGSCVAGPGNQYRAEGNANDAVGGAHATFSSASYASGRYGQSFSFNGAGQYVALPPAVGDFGAGDFTVAVWLNTTSPIAVSDVLSKRGSCSGGSPYQGFDLRMGGVAGNLYLEIWTSAGYVGFGTSGVRVNDGLWHHVAVVRQGSAVRIHVDGTTRATSAISGSIVDPTNTPVYLGVGRCVPGAPGSNGAQDGTAWLNGRLDEVGLYRRAMSASELTATAQGLCAP